MYGWALQDFGCSLLLALIVPVSAPSARAALTPWQKQRAVHLPGKILLDVALAVALGGDCLADVGMLRAGAGRVRASVLRLDGLPPGRHPGRGRTESPYGDPGRASLSSPICVEVGWYLGAGYGIRTGRTRTSDKAALT